jgi:hypothetical protein
LEERQKTSDIFIYARRDQLCVFEQMNKGDTHGDAEKQSERRHTAENLHYVSDHNFSDHRSLYSHLSLSVGNGREGSQ